MSKLKPRKTLTGYVLAIWLLGIFVVRLYVQLVFSGQGGMAIAAQAIGVTWPLVYFIFFGKGFLPREVDSVTLLVLTVFASSALISCFVSPAPFISFGYVLATLVGIYVALMFNSNFRQSDFLHAFKLLSLLGIAMLLAYTKYDYRTYPGYRLGDGTDTMNPNSVGMITMACVAAAFAYKSTIFRLLIIIPSLLIIYLTGSRAAAAATLITIGIVTWHNFRQSSGAKKLLVFIPLVTFSLSWLVWNWQDFYELLNEFFKWDDKHRGLASGASGRLIVWGWMWDLIKDNFLIGVGFRAHGEFIQASSAHNGYLALLADIGIFGFSAIAMYVVWRILFLYQCYIRSRAPIAAIYFGFAVGFLALAFFERYLLNIGNPGSLMFLLILFLSKKRFILAVSYKHIAVRR